MLPFAIFSIVSALILYTIGVWGEKFAGWLKPWHLALFFAGLVFDTTGTTLMSEIAHRFEANLHGLTGIAAILLMLFHAGWATTVLATKQENMRANFHKFSLVVWLIWLVPFTSGMVMAMNR
jgi:uncharacterized repeat protein (TIGR03987 family)